MRETWGCGIVLVCALLVAGCHGPDQPMDAGAATLSGAGQLASIQARHELVVVTRNTPTIWYIDRDGDEAGPEHDLAEAFAHALGVKARFIVVDSVAAMLHAVADGKADMAAGSITLTPERERQFTFGPEYSRVWQDVVCNRDNRPRSVADLVDVDKLVVAADTSYVERLRILAKTHPRLHWKTERDVGTEWLLAEVADGRIGCTIADSNIVAINRRYHPSLLVPFRLGKAQHLAWPMPKGSNELRKAAVEWLGTYRDNGELAALKSKYYGFIGQWNYVDKRALARRIKSVYPKYKHLFVSAAKIYDFSPWRLAAQAYQESHWKPHATSPTGVRGMMMLTQRTARAMGVDNRLNPKQSVMAGAAYLRKMEKKLPDAIEPPARYYFALAAYNIGYYHLRDAMHLAKRLERNPHSWAAVRKTLPLLMQRKYYRTVKYGYARGREAVRYVRRIRDYGDIIRHHARSTPPPDEAIASDTPTTSP